MKKFLLMMTAGLMALLCFNSCEIHDDEFDYSSMDVFLTAYYAGGMPPQTSQGRYDVESPFLYDRDVENLFHELSGVLPAGFTDAVMEVYFYDWMDNLLKDRRYEFFWVTEDYVSGRGYYGWEEVFD